MEKSEERANGRRLNILKRNIVSALGVSPLIEIESNRRVTLEGSRGVLHYSNETIKISLSGFVAVFEGRNLRLQSISPTALVLEGFFTSVRFEV